MSYPEQCRPDFYIAAMGRSGSTLLCDWLSDPPEQIVLSEPFFFSDVNPTMLRIQLENFGYKIDDGDWYRTDESWQDRFRRLFEPVLRGRAWAFKEVLSSEHRQVVASFSPPRVVVSVRDIRDVAASFLEKHKIQQNFDRFDHAWVRDYCLTQSESMVSFCQELAGSGPELRIQRYEDFIASEGERSSLAQFVGWKGGGKVGRHHLRLDRAFEIARHGTSVSSKMRQWQERDLTPDEMQLAEEIAEKCEAYQRFFGYF